ITSPRPSPAIAAIAISNCSRQWQRREPSTSPVKHCECTRSSGVPWLTSPRMRANALSLRRPRSSRRRSNPTARNTPHLVGSVVETTRRTVPMPTAVMLLPAPFFSVVARLAGGRERLGAGDGSAGTQAIDLPRVEAELLEDLFVMLAELRGTPGRDFGHVVHLNRAAHRELQMSARALEGYDKVIGRELRVLRDVVRRPHDPEGDVGLVERLLPVCHRLRGEKLIQDGRQLLRVGHLLGRIRKAWIGQQVGPADPLGKRG